MIRSVPMVLVAALVGAGCTTPSRLPDAAVADDAVPLIERSRLFGNPSKVGGRLSPDGQWLSWIAPRDGVLNVWVAPVADPDRGRPMTAEQQRPIRSAFWSPDSRTVLYINDKGGDENFLLYGVDVASGALQAYTPFEKTRARIVKISRKVKDRILIGLNNRDPRWHDVHSLDLASGRLTLVHRNDGDGGYVADDDLVLRLAQRPRADGGDDYFRLVDGRAEATAFVSVGMADSQTTAPQHIAADGRTMYWTDSRGRDKAALVARDLSSGAMRMVAEDPRADIGSALYDPQTGEAQAYAAEYLKSEYVGLTPAMQADLKRLQSATSGQFTITSRSDDDSRWLVAMDPVTAPSSTWLYDRRAQSLSKLFVSRPEMEGAPLVPMHALEIPSRDGLTLVSYLSLPRTVDPGGSGKAARPVPLVLLVHGGPWDRDQYGGNPYHQWLANRGYAVLAVNFRGSVGFGKSFVSAGDGEWGRKMQDDLLDAVDWAVRAGVTRRDQVAIMGGSYGGYATLAGLAFTPRAFACGVDIVGPSDLTTLLGAIPAYWESGKQQIYRRMGDPTTEAGRAWLAERSPLHAADKIVRPLLIGQGANDPRVNVRESDRIVAAMAAKRIPVTYVLFPDEGHGFARPANNIAFNAVTENFLAQCLGGRAEGIGGTLKASTAQVKHGAEFTRGLAEALAAGP